jgi:hypothetical protein
MDLDDNEVYFRRPLGSPTFTSFPPQLIFENIERVSDGSDCEVGDVLEPLSEEKPNELTQLLNTTTY